MSDIDFDELDKAVNSLVGDGAESPKIDSSDKPAGVSSEKSPTAPTTSLPSRRAGKFMDMKHSPSNAPINSGQSMMSSAHSTNISPVGSHNNDNKASLDSDVKPKNDWPDPIDAAQKDNQSDDNNTSDDAPKSTDMPDPLDHIKDQASESDNKPDADFDSKISEEKSDNKDSKDDDESLPSKDELKMEFEETDPKQDDKKPSPFLDDAKVDKRPLGGFTGESSSPIPSDKDEEKLSEVPAEVPTETIELPPELDKDLVAIEAGEAPEISKNPNIGDHEKEESKDDDSDKKDKDSKDKSKKEDKKDPEKDHKDKVSQLLASAASGSIPEQYKRENRSHELHGADHPLFDSEHFKNSPASAPKKSKSKVGKVVEWIFIIVGLLSLGGALGVAVFVFVN